MKINTLMTVNFKGLEGQRMYDLSNGLVAFCQSNGSGKTSIIEALRFVLAGTTTSEMVFRGQASAFAQIETAGGNTYSRKIFVDSKRSVECAFNGKKISARELNDRLAAETGVAIENAKIASSGELLTGLTSQQLGDVLLRYLPEQLTKEIFLEKLPNATESQVRIVSELVDKMLEGRVPDEEGVIHFDTKMVELVHRALTERRKQLKKAIGENEAAIRQFEALGRATGTKDQFEAEKAKLMQMRDNAVVYATKKQAYEQAVEMKKRYDAQLMNLDKQIGEITAVMHTPEERNTVVKAMQSLWNTGSALKQVLTSTQSEIKQLKSDIENLKNPVCPLSKDLICRTDKTVVAEDLKRRWNEQNDTFLEQKKQYAAAIEDYNKFTAQLQQIDADNMAAQKKQTLLAQKAQLEANKPVIPEEPAKGEDIRVIDAKLNEIDKNLYILANAENCEKLKVRVNYWKAMLNDYEYLVTQFSPKGAVKEAITAYYLDDFAEMMNEKAAMLNDHMSIKFVSDRGVVVLADVHGTGNYLPYESLSGGEQACVMFLLLDLLSTLSGFGIIILDELSVLDNRMFGKLISLVCESITGYDNVILSAVDHEDTLKIIEKNNIPLMEC